MDSINTGLYIEDDRLYDFAASTAKLLRPTGSGRGSQALPALRRALEAIRRTHAVLQKRGGSLATVPAAWEWLLDNWYMVQQEYLDAAAALRQSGPLRRCEEGLMILELGRALLRSGLGRLSEGRCRAFLDGFQSVTVLRRGELALFPVAVRAAALEEIAAVCGRMQYAAETEEYAAALEALFTTLRLFSVLDLEKLLTAADVTGAVLAADPTGDYPRMDRETRQDYLRRIETLARRAGLEEHIYARQLIKTAKAEGKHVGAYLFHTPGPGGGRLYIAANVLLTLFFSLLPAIALGSIPAALLLLLPVSELTKSLLDFLLLHLLRPRRLPRMDMEKGVPPEGKTLCVLSALLTDEAGAAAMAKRLEELRLCCRSEGRNLAFGILADLPGAAERETAEDEAILRAARSAVNRLNREYRGGFYLFTRERVFDGEQWTGWERKRGAILELARLLCDRPSALHVTGERDLLAGTRYILTLDSDTRLYPGAAGELIGAMLHPLCRPQVDEGRRVVTRGHAILHPRMDTELKSANATDFALIFAGAGGSDPYGGLCGELYMDAFDNGGFAGKGLIDAQALLRCTEERIPEGRVLSHDALEGACLRGAFVGDAAFSDSFPARPLAYYKRLHRWVRGDWQNLPYVFCRDFTELDRWRLFDSLRRSLIAPMTLLAILFGFFLPGKGLTVSAWAALLALLSRLFLSLAEGGARRREPVRLRRYTRLLGGVGGAIVQTFIRLWLLPYEAWVCLSAIGAALWRMLISHKRLLQWQTAAQSEQSADSLAAYGRAFWQSIALGLGLLALSPTVIGKSAGLMWLLSPLAALALALPAHREAELSQADRALLREAAGEAFHYYTDFSTAEDNFLPPDNFQEQPPVGVAHRTSPTNIGLAMASAVAAADMELIEREEAVSYLSRVTGTLERMPRHMGHYYNWYDTRSLTPLRPAFVSTVDSGNLYAALLTVRRALLEWGEEALGARIGALLAPMDFGPLYDKGRGLLYICYDTEQERGAGGWYDLMASEAMLTSYLAIAKGDVPKKHWRRLSRGQLQKDGYRGLASWTGTMFEYLMPNLFLPLYRGSLLYESGRFCVYVQKRRVFPGKPWGISESAFYSLDPALSYRYKANGCGALALKRGQDADMVVSPYSSFLALAVDPAGAARNLRRLEQLGARGRWGYMEALDFTPERCRSDSGEKVRCYMAHHIGMSVIAAANALCGGSMQRRFLAEPAMAAYDLLLQERLPDTGAVLRRDRAELPEKPLGRADRSWLIQGDAAEKERRFCLLSNGSYHLMADNRGHAAASCAGLSVYGAPLLGGEGDGLMLELLQKGQVFALTPAEAPERWELADDHCRWERRLPALEAAVMASAAAGELGERRSVELRSTRDGMARLRLRLRPVLARYADYSGHPAYWQLGLEAQEAEGALLLRRLRRGEQEELWLCLCCDLPAKTRFDPALPEAVLELELALKGEESVFARFALCLARSKTEALEGARRILNSPDRGDMVGAAALRLGMNGEEIGAAMSLLRELRAPLRDAAPKRELWQYGISGDMPLLCCEGRAVEALPLLRRFLLLKSCGVESELAYLTDEQGEYQRPCYRRVQEALRGLGLEALLESRGGVHFAPLSAAETVRSRAAVTVGEPRWGFGALQFPALSLPREREAPPLCAWEEDGFSFEGLPARVWQQVLTNGHLGCIAADCGPGALWLENARELRLLRPMEALRGVRGAEALWSDTDGERLSLFAANDGRPCRVCFTPGAAVWEKELAGRRVRTTAFIPRDCNARVLLIEGAAGLNLRWALEPLLGAQDGAAVRCRFAEGLFHAENPECYLPEVEFLAGAGVFCSCRTDFTPAAMLMSLVGEERTVLVCGCCGEERLRALLEPEAAAQALRETLAYWRALLGRAVIQTGNGPLDRYLYPWAAYQSIACRLEGRSSLYQSGGAIGFRDQLQDGVNLLLLTQAPARERILDACRHQYVEGDVMHWWHPHPEGDRGVRTRCGDDLLWLVWALCEYVEATGDLALCEREESYISSPPLRPEEWDRYETPGPAGASASVLFHAKAALDCCIARGFGEHGLPWFGSGDWNDGLDRVDGESVWLGWFFAHCAGRFAGLLRRLGKPGAERYRDYARRLGLAADAAWNGGWYRRGYWRDGGPLGGDRRIDILPQAWAALSGYAQPRRVEQALDAALARLVDEKQGLVRLFDPPFDAREPYPGYIAGYGAGIRENGGQYTHGAIWLALALLERDRPDDAWRVLRLLLPENHDLRRYEAEPFVLPADVCAAPGREGQAGWTWYTGSAAWYFRVVTRELLGLRLENGALCVRPRLPAALDGASVRWTDREGVEHAIEIKGGAVTVDGEVKSEK